MHNYYDIKDGEKYLCILKRFRFITVAVFMVLFISTSLLTYFTSSRAVMVTDIVLYSLFFIYLDIYMGFIKKYYLSRYHLLAEIVHYDHEMLTTIITGISEREVTVKNIRFAEVTISGGRILFMEKEFLGEINMGSEVTLDIVDNIIVGTGR